MPNRLSIFSSRFPRPLLGILLFVVAVVVIETAFAIALPEHFLWRRMNQVLDQVVTEPAPAVQIMGDSTAVYGYDMETMNGTNAASLVYRQNAVAGTGPVYAYFFLKRQLASGRKPGAIVYSTATHTFGSSRIPLYVSRCLNFREIVDVLAAGAKITEVTSGFLNGSLYSLRHREHLRNLLKARDRKVLSEFWAPADERLPVPENPPGPTTVVESYDELRLIYRSPFYVNKLNRVYVERFLQLAKDEGIQVYWVTMPVHDAIYQSREKLQFYQDYGSLLESFEHRFGIIVPDGSVPVMNATNFFDDTHLNEHGAKIFTRRMAQTLKDVGVTSRHQSGDEPR